MISIWHFYIFKRSHETLDEEIMVKEIERKFLVKGNYKPFVTEEVNIIQAYLSSAPERSVRIRLEGEKGFLTIKGLGSKSGLSRHEWEMEIPVDEARALLNICEPGVIEKTRHHVPEKTGLIFEVDEFHGDNEGLTMAEIELPTEDHPFEKPEWLDKEVTGDERYYNIMLIKSPFKTW